MPSKGQFKDHIGEIYDSGKYGKYRVVRELIAIGYNQRMFEVEFLNTGGRRDVALKSLGQPLVDHMVPNVAGVGYFGNFFMNVRDDILTKSLYDTWCQMMHRCYNINAKDYKYWGGSGVTVDPRWHNFTNFYHDAKLLPGFTNKYFHPHDYQLDKDYLQFGVPKNQKVYSKDTCIWISKEDNSMIMTRENGNKTGYMGVYQAYNGAYYCIVNKVNYGKFITAEAAANMFNYVYPATRSVNSEIEMLNNVPVIPYEELINYMC